MGRRRMSLENCRGMLKMKIKGFQMKLSLKKWRWKRDFKKLTKINIKLNLNKMLKMNKF